MAMPGQLQTVKSVSYASAGENETETTNQTDAVRTDAVKNDVNTEQDKYKKITCFNCQCCSCCISVYKVITILLLYLLDIILLLFIFLYSILFRVPYCIISKCCCYRCGSCNKTNDKQQILIIGYSFAGIEIHKLLQRASLQHYEFIVVEPKEYIEFTPAILTSIINPNRYKSISFPVRKCFHPKNSNLIQGKVISLSSNAAIIQMAHDKSTKSIDFDYCFICSGSKYASPIKVNPNISDHMLYKNREKQLKDVHQTLLKAHSVGIIGGGPVGVELMAEIVTHLPDTLVTVMDRNASLCASFPESTRQYFMQWVNNHENVTLQLNKRITKIVDPSEVQLQNTEIKENKYAVYIMNHAQENESKEEDLLQFDIIFKCNGFEPNSELLRAQDSDDFKLCIDDKYKSILVDDWLRVCGHQHIYALGDVMKLSKVHEIKLANTAEWNAIYLSELMQYKHKNKDSEFKPYHEWLFGDKASNDGVYEMPMVFSISLGSWDGAMGFFDVLSTGCCSQIIKWFIKWTFCKCWQRAPLFRIEYRNYTIFEMYIVGYQISDLLWRLMHRMNRAKVIS